jgi:hypothetical protein
MDCIFNCCLKFAMLSDKAFSEIEKLLLCSHIKTNVLYSQTTIVTDLYTCNAKLILLDLHCFGLSHLKVALYATTCHFCIYCHLLIYFLYFSSFSPKFNCKYVG